MSAVDSQRKWNYRNGGEKKRKWSKGGSGSLAKAEQDKRDEGKEMEDNRRWKERLWRRQGEGACGQEQIKHPVRYPSVPGLEFGQLRKGSWVKGQATRWPEGSVVSVLAGTHMGQDYKVNKEGALFGTDQPPGTQRQILIRHSISSHKGYVCIIRLTAFKRWISLKNNKWIRIHVYMCGILGPPSSHYACKFNWISVYTFPSWWGWFIVYLTTQQDSPLHYEGPQINQVQCSIRMKSSDVEIPV